MADPHRAVMGRAVDVPIIDKSACADGEIVAAIGVPDFQDWAGDRFTFGYEQLESALHRLNDRKEGHRAMLH